MKTLKLKSLVVAVVILKGCADQAENVSEFRHVESIQREFSISKTSNQTGQGDSLQSRVMKATRADSELWNKLENERNNLAPVFLIYLAEHVVATNEKKAIEWYWLGLIRARLDASLCSDQTAKSGIGFIAGLAPSVLQAMRLDQETTAKIGKKVLKRRDLKVSRASPWWICSHGAISVANSVQKKLAAKMTEEEAREIGVDKSAVLKADETDWLIPEDQMAARYEDVVAEYEAIFSRMLEAFRDPIEMTSDPLLPTPLIDQEAVDGFYWISDKTLLILKGGRENEVYVRYEGSESETLIKRSFPLELCISPMRVMVNSDDLEMLQFKKRWRQEFTSWHIKDGIVTPENMATRSFSNAPIYARQRVGRHNLNSNDRERHKQSTLSCNWLDENDLGQVQERVSDWTDISPFPGFLVTYEDNAKFGTGTYYLRETNAPPEKISDAILPLDCMRYIRHRNAILANACVTGNPENLRTRYGWDTGSIIWLDMENGQLKSSITETPKHPSQKNATQVIPTKAGIVRLVRKIETPDGSRSGGLYMEAPNGGLHKIWNGWIERAELSPDGCRIAFTANYRAIRNIYTGEINKLYTANICDYADITNP